MLDLWKWATTAKVLRQKARSSNRYYYHTSFAFKVLLSKTRESTSDTLAKLKIVKSIIVLMLQQIESLRQTPTLRTRTMSTMVTAEEIRVNKISILNSIFDTLIETTGIRRALDSESESLDFCREEFLAIQLRNQSFFASEYSFVSTASVSMKLAFSTWDGFSVLTQSRDESEIANVVQANARLATMGYRS